MTYLQFHFVFTLPLIALLTLWAYLDHRRGKPLSGSLGRGSRAALISVGIHLLLALVYTTPWDNYLVYRQVWGYPEGRVLFTIGYVPFEEYLFFILQTLIAALSVFTVARYVGEHRIVLLENASLIRAVSAGLAMLGAAAGVLLLTQDWGTYLGLILVWAMPVLALQLSFGADILLQRWRLVLPAVLLPTLYLWFADHYAIVHQGIWWISPELTTGLAPFGLPIEEAIFFLMPNLFVVFGITLGLSPFAFERLGRLLPQLRSWWRMTFVLWALSMIPAPLIPDAFPILAYLSTVLLALAMLGYALERYGRRTWLLFVVTLVFGTLVEWLGESTGIPFGAYQYTAPGPSLLGVPLLVPLGWWAFTLIALAVAPVAKLWLAPLALVAWDVGLDPLMVAKGFWVFEPAGFYYGVPLTNFLGWYVAGLSLCWLLLRLEPRLRAENSPELRLVFVVQMFLICVGLMFFGMPVAALVTFLAMGAYMVPHIARFGQRLRLFGLR